MAKRPAELVEDGQQAYLKRQKLSVPGKPAKPAVEINSARQLKKILTFDQDNGHSKHSIQAFKSFLDGFTAADADIAYQTSILREFFELQKSSAENDLNEPFLPELMQTWSFASQSNDESLLSAVPAVLALLLRTISTIHGLVEHGLKICRTLLHKRQQELIARGVTTNKSKEFVIAPALRLLREMVLFDGGALAKQVFRHRDQLFKCFARNLNLRLSGDRVEDWKKPSVRTNALRLFLALIKFLPGDAKRELLNQRDIVSAVTRDIKDDPPYMVREVLEALKTSVLLDETLPREARTKVVNATFLGRLVMLYRYDQAEDENAVPKKSVDAIAHEFLLVACISFDLGVLNRQTGFYPRGINPDEIHDADITRDLIDLDLESIEWIDKFATKIPVRNTILADFVQNLRPWSSLKQSELLIAILKSAPELTAEYFYGKKSFGFEPKLTATWIGYSAFIFSALQLPIPQYFGYQERYARLPPPTAIVVENLLPQPLSQKVLTRCLNQPHNLITFFAIRLLCVAFKKLKDVLKMYREAAAASSSVWNKAAERVIEEFCQRCPSIKDVINTYRILPATELLQRQATTELLVLYYEAVPQLALDAKFDVSGALTQALAALDDSALISEDYAMRAMELESLFQFALFSPGMRWFTKAEGIPISPFTAMLKLYTAAPSAVPLLKLKSVISSVVNENQLLQSSTPVAALDALVLRLGAIQGTQAEDTIYQFLDDCLARCASKPVKYIFSLEEIHTEAHGSDKMKFPASLLTLAMLEQWPFIVNSLDDSSCQAIADFLFRYLAASIKIGEDERTLNLIIQRLVAATPEDLQSTKILAQARKLNGEVAIPELQQPEVPEVSQKKENMPSATEKQQILATMLDVSGLEAENNSALTKWINKELDEVVEGGHLAALVKLLSSNHLSVRKEAAICIAKLAAKLRESSFEEKEQMWLLLSELIETSRPVIDKEPLPSFLSSFAAHSIAVLNEPLHALYPKVNKFLSQGPVWELDKIPLMYKLLDEAPSLDDAHYIEAGWLLSCMLDGLQTSADMSSYRKRRVFEKLLSLWNNAYLPANLRDKMLRILFRATTVEGGSTTLITRFSAMTWLDAQVALTGGVPLQVLMGRILESCDRQRVETWSRGGIKVLREAQMLP